MRVSKTIIGNRTGTRAGRLLALLAIVVLLAALPMTALAQGEPPHVFIGTAVVNGQMATPGTSITAWDGTRQIGATTVSGGEYILNAARSSGVITFKVDNLDADRMHQSWTPGQVTIGFDLTVYEQAAGCLSNTSWRPVAEAPRAAPGEPPHVFIGTVVVNGLTAAPGVLITAWDGTEQIGVTKVTAGGAFAIQVFRSSGPITFRIDTLDADRIHPSWTLGGVTTGFNLNAVDSGNCWERKVPVAQVETALGGKLVRVFSFDNDRKVWLFYDPRVPQASTLEQFVAGQSYFILVTETTEVNLNCIYRSLICHLGNCWNLIVW